MVATKDNLGYVRLTLFRNRNTYNDDKKSLKRGFRSYWSTKWLLNYHVSVHVCRNGFPNYLKRETIPLIPIPEYSQSNATLVTSCHGNATRELKHRRSWATDGNRKLKFFLFGAFWRHHVCNIKQQTSNKSFLHPLWGAKTRQKKKHLTPE